MKMQSKHTRRLSVEPLETRSLLTAVLPPAVFPPPAGAAPAGQPPAPLGQSAAASQLDILLPPGVPTGVPVQVMAFAATAGNQPAPSYNGTAVLTSSDTGATSNGANLPVNITFVNGLASFSVTFAATGTESLLLTDTTNSISGTASTTVGTPSIPTPAAATQLALQLPSTVPSGVPVMVQALAEDAKGHPVPGYSGSATLTIANGTATVNGTALPDTVTITNGRAQIPVVFTATGTPTLTLTDNATTNALTAAMQTVTVNTSVAPPAPPAPPTPPAPAAASQLGLMLPPTVPSNVPVMAMVVAQDAHGHPVPGYSGTATLTIANGSATVNGTALPYTVTITNGRAQIPLVFTATGTPTLTLTDNAASNPLTAATRTVTVNAAPTVGAPTQLAILLPPPPMQGGPPPSATPVLPEGQAVMITLQAEDANGNWVSNYSGTATLAITGGTATSNGTSLPATVTITNGQAQILVDFTSTGTVTLTLTDAATTSPLSTATVTVTVTDSKLPPPPPPH